MLYPLIFVSSIQYFVFVVSLLEELVMKKLSLNINLNFYSKYSLLQLAKLKDLKSVSSSESLWAIDKEGNGGVRYLEDIRKE